MYRKIEGKFVPHNCLMLNYITASTSAQVKYMNKIMNMPRYIFETV